MEKMDARKRYTQMVLKQSFLKLLKEKPVNRITVKEVCALAQLNRATFYAVSYTHLDVYKRQAKDCTSSRPSSLSPCTRCWRLWALSITRRR